MKTKTLTLPLGRHARRVERDLQAVGALAQAVLDSDDENALLAQIAQEAQRLVGAKATMVVTIEGDPETMTVRSLIGVAGGPLAVGSTRLLAETPIAELVRSGTVLVRRGSEEVSPAARAIRDAYQVGPVVAVPIASGGVTRGVLFAGKAADAAPFREPDIRLLATFAHQAASAIHLGELRAAEANLTVGAEQDRIARDLHDGIVQSLYGLGMGWRASMARSPDADLVAMLNDVLGRLDTAITTVREYISNLEARPSSPPLQLPAMPPRALPVWANEDALPPDVIDALGFFAEASMVDRDLGSVLSSLVSSVIERSDAAFGVLGTLVDDGTALAIRFAAGASVVGRSAGDIVPLNETLAAEAIRRGRPVVVAAPADASPRLRETIRRLGCGPIVAVPMAVRGRVFGGVAVGRSPGSRPFSRAEVDMIEAHSVQAAITLEFDRVRHELRRAVIIEERRRVGIDLHDRVIHMLFGIGLTLQSHEASTRDASTRASLRSAVDSIDRAIRDLRRYVFNLGPSLAVDHRLDDELRALASDLVANTTLTLTVDIDPAVSGMAADPAGEILHIAREAISNVVQHSRADHCVVRLLTKPGQVVLEIVDDGRGVPDGSAASGHGLRNIRTRASALGGRLEIRPNRPHGTVVRLAVPIAAASAAGSDRTPRE